MPTCDIKANPKSLGSLSAAELDHHASEAAKVKRTKEQAYFNSYDFDAIEVIPYDEDEEDHSHLKQHQHHHHHHGSHSGHHPKYTVGGCRTCHQILQSASVSPSPGINSTLPTVSHSHILNSRPHHHPSQQQQQQHLKKTKVLSSRSSNHSSSTNSSISSFSHPKIQAKTKQTYLNRIGAFFVSHSMGKRSSIDSLADIEKQTHQINRSASSSQISLDNNIRSVGKLYDGGSTASGSNKRDHVIDDAVNSNFLLPRAMLKYQSTGFVNSMPLVISKLGGSSTSLKSNSIRGQLNQVINSSSNSTSSKSQPSTVESSISASDAVTTTIINGNLKKPPNLISTKSAIENSGFISSSSSASASASSLSVAKSSLSAESSIIGETSANVDVSGSSALATSSAPVGSSKSITNRNVVSSITSDLQQSYNEKLALSSSSSTTAVVGASVSAGSCNGGGTTSTSSIIMTKTNSGSGDAATTGHSSSSSKGVRERTSSQSHYSTDKSGSSGYYSSNVCSTYSVEDHIYCEPVIDILEVSKSTTLKSTKLGQQSNKIPPRKIMIVHNSDDDDDDHHRHRQQSVHDLQQKQNLRILETSIENLDRHLKNYPKLSAQDRIASFVRSNPQAIPTNFFQVHNANTGGGYDAMKNRYGHLPTIMESGPIDGQGSLQNTWQEEIAEDSLLDIDLDSFLLVSEGKSNNGIDNPTFNKSDVLHDEDMENNYKCAKYINSCPEDAYRLESEVGNSIDHFLKKYEDQIHFQNTRELLEDVRDKIRLLSEASEETGNTNTDRGVVDTNLPQELETMIKALKSELESYLERMNHHSEMEIRQLCNGLVKNQNIVKMKKAFERRKSNASESEYDIAYEAIRDTGTIVTVQHTRQRIETTSIRCTSDPNFKMKRKSLCDVFPTMDAECYGVAPETVMVAGDISDIGNGGGGNSGASVMQPTSSVLSDSTLPATSRTQLQKNLSFHKPILNKLDGETGGDEDKDSILDWHQKKPSIWEMYYGTNRMNQTLLGKRAVITNGNQAILSYPSSRPESDFTLDLPRAEQLRIKMEKEKKFRRRCRYLTTFLSLVFFLLTVVVVSLVLTRGKRMFGSMI